MRTRSSKILLGAVLALLVLTSAAHVVAQDPSPMPPSPEPTLPASEVPGVATDPKILAEQVRQLAQMNQKLMEQLGNLSEKYEDLNRKVDSSSSKSSGGSSGGTSAGSGSGSGGSSGGSGATSSGARSNSADRDGGSPRAGGGSGGGVRDTSSSQEVGNRRIGKIPLKGSYDYDRAGFLWETEDNEFTLKIRSLIQADERIFQQSNQNPVSSGASIPRVRWYFSGRITKPIEYQVSLQDSFGAASLLNAYLNFNYFENKLQFRIGRFKTPFTYEFYKIPIQDLFAPERSIYNVNFQGNRQAGLMFWGELFDRRFEYAIGAFDGGRNTYQSFSNNQDAIGFFNIKPFLNSEDSIFRNLNLGGSFDYGDERNYTSPVVLRTTQQASTAALNSTNAANTSSVPFLAFNNNVTEHGIRSQYELHLAYYFKGLALLGAWDSGSDTYSLTSQGSPGISVPTGGYSVQAAYLITGETRNNFGSIEPLRPFDLRKGKFGIGAIEPTFRFSTIYLGRDVFNAGLADPNLWTNSAYMTDLGFNWYLNNFTKIYFDWNHDVFGEPVYYRPGAQQKTADLFWFRFQLYF